MQSLLSFALVSLCVVCVCVVATPTDVVHTKYGDIQGSLDSTKKINIFFGIPYASPPVGELRFRSPVAPAAWTGVRKADKTPTECVQSPRVFGSAGSEDCLYLNVFSPANATQQATPLPVLFWIHGGAFVRGDSWYEGKHDARSLVTEHNVIVVSINYRLGVFGLLAHTALGKEDPSGSLGNFGLQDQRAAMQWVKDNIRSFGGDPNQVTIWGESAGAFSVCFHLASPASEGLFHAAIMESATCDNLDFFQPRDIATKFGETYAKAVGCNSAVLPEPEFLSCLRNRTINQLNLPASSWFCDNWPECRKSDGSVEPYEPEPMALPSTDTTGAADLPANAAAAAASASASGDSASLEHVLFHSRVLQSSIRRSVTPHATNLAPAMPWGVTVDGTRKGLLRNPYEQFRTGSFNKVPVIMGTNRDEGSVFLLAVPVVVPGVGLPLNDGSIIKVLSHFFNDTTVQAITSLYPAKAFPNANSRVSNILRDFAFVCPSRRAMRAMTAANTPVFMYQFTFPVRWAEAQVLGEYHSVELEFVFNNPYPAWRHKFDEKDTAIAAAFGRFWTNLAKHRDPNGVEGVSAESGASVALPAGFQWPRFSLEQEEFIRFDVPMTVNNGLQVDECQFWDTITELFASQRTQ